MTDPEKIYLLRLTLLVVIQNMPSHFPGCSYDLNDTRMGSEFCNCRMDEYRSKAHEALAKTR